MARKRRRSSFAKDLFDYSSFLPSCDPFSRLSDELLLRILHQVPISTLLECQRVSHRFYDLAGDSQIWKDLYYRRFVRPRTMRSSGARSAQNNGAHRAKRRKWQHEPASAAGRSTSWKSRYKLQHNWSIGACEVQEIRVTDCEPVPSMLVKLAEGVIVTVDVNEGLRAWDLKGKHLIASCDIGTNAVPTSLAVSEDRLGASGLDIVIGFETGIWGIWRFDPPSQTFSSVYSHTTSGSQAVAAVAFCHPYMLTITDRQLLSLYAFDRKDTHSHDDLTTLQSPPDSKPRSSSTGTAPLLPSTKPHLLASLKSHTSWPPLSLSIRKTPSAIIASIAFSVPTYPRGYTVGMQELHLDMETGMMVSSRLAYAVPQGFSSLGSSVLSSASASTSSGPSTPSSAISTRPPTPTPSVSLANHPPTSLSYAHPYLLLTHANNTLTLYLCTSTNSSLHLSPGTQLYGHTSAISSAAITSRGKAVSVSARGDEVRIWELEGASAGTEKMEETGNGKMKRRTETLPSRSGGSANPEHSIRIQRPPPRKRRRTSPGPGDGAHDGGEGPEERETRRRWVGFDDQVVLVLEEADMETATDAEMEGERGASALVVYDFS